MGIGLVVLDDAVGQDEVVTGLLRAADGAALSGVEAEGHTAPVHGERTVEIDTGSGAVDNLEAVDDSILGTGLGLYAQAFVLAVDDTALGEVLLVVVIDPAAAQLHVVTKLDGTVELGSGFHAHLGKLLGAVDDGLQVVPGLHGNGRDDAGGVGTVHDVSFGRGYITPDEVVLAQFQTVDGNDVTAGGRSACAGKLGTLGTVVLLSVDNTPAHVVVAEAGREVQADVGLTVAVSGQDGGHRSIQAVRLLVHDGLLGAAGDGEFGPPDDAGGVTAHGEGGCVARLAHLDPGIQGIRSQGAGHVHRSRMRKVVLNQTIGILLDIPVCLGAACDQKGDTGKCEQYLFHFDHHFKGYCQDGGFLSLPALLLICSEG